MEKVLTGPDAQEALIEAVKGQNLWHGRSRPTSPAGAATALAILSGLRARGFDVVRAATPPATCGWTNGCDRPGYHDGPCMPGPGPTTPEPTRPCPMCGAPLAPDDTHFSLLAGPAGDYVWCCPDDEEPRGR